MTKNDQMRMRSITWDQIHHAAAHGDLNLEEDNTLNIRQEIHVWDAGEA
jgi:hypothetical protein